MKGFIIVFLLFEVFLVQVISASSSIEDSFNELSSQSEVVNQALNKSLKKLRDIKENLQAAVLAYEVPLFNIKKRLSDGEHLQEAANGDNFKRLRKTSISLVNVGNILQEISILQQLNQSVGRGHKGGKSRKSAESEDSKEDDSSSEEGYDW